MNLFFDEMSQKLIIDAKKEMFNLKHPYVGSEHLLLSILSHKELEVTHMLNSFGIYYDNFYKELVKVVGVGSRGNDWFLFTPLLKRIINNATYYSKDNDVNVTPYSLLVSILQEGDGVANRILLGMNIDLVALTDKFISSSNYNNTNSKLLLDELAVNMNKLSLDSKYDPVIGRDKEIDSLIQILLRKNKNNPLLVGDAGVGKTALVEEVARRITLGDVPLKLKDKVIYNLPMSVLVSGTKYRGEFEEKFNKIIKELIDNSNIILFIDEIHTIMGAGGAEGAIDASNIIKPYLARGDLKIIGATTLYEYNKYIEKDKAFDRRFQKIIIEEASDELVRSILFKLRGIYEEFHHVKISDDIINSIIDLSNKCIFKGRQPDKAIDLLDEVCSYSSSIHNERDISLRDMEVKIKEIESLKNNSIIKRDFKEALVYKNHELQLRSEYNNLLFNNNLDTLEVLEDDLYRVIRNKTSIPLRGEVMKKWNKNKLLQVYGQDDVVNSFMNSICNYDFINCTRPLSFLFVGKSGLGKTFLIDEVSKNIFSTSDLIRVDISEYYSEYSISKLLGTYSGYIGYDDTNSLFFKIRHKGFFILVLENIDKCNKSLLDIFISSIKTGLLENGRGEVCNISKSIIIFTSNIVEANVGFSDRVSYSSILSDLMDSVSGVIKFNEIDEDTVREFIKNKYHISNKRKIDKIVRECDYSKYGFSKIDRLVSSEIIKT